MDCAVDDTNGLAKRIPLFDSWESTPRAHWVSRAFHHFLYESIAARIRQHLARRKNVEEKKMFGGVGFLLHGNMLVGVWKDSLIARLGPDEGDLALLERHVKEFDITGRAMKGWVLVGPEGVEGDEQLDGWIERATKFVKRLPAK